MDRFEYSPGRVSSQYRVCKCIYNFQFHIGRQYRVLQMDVRNELAGILPEFVIISRSTRILGVFTWGLYSLCKEVKFDNRKLRFKLVSRVPVSRDKHPKKRKGQDSRFPSQALCMNKRIL